MIIVKSAFRVWNVLLWLILTVWLFAISVFFLLMNGILPIIFLGALFLFMTVIMIFGYLRKYLAVITFSSSYIEVRYWLGLGISRQYNNADIRGYRVIDIKGNIQSNQVLFLLTNRGKRLKISEHYHKNYKDLRDYVYNNYSLIEITPVKQYNNSGVWRFLRDEITDAFSRT